MSMRPCPSCGEPAPPEANWCEACGADLNAAPVIACTQCGDGIIGDDGYCGSCGAKAPGPRDHLEDHVGRAVAVSDRGLRHHHNEDAFALGEVPDGAVLVVCDGVSSTAGSAEASAAAAAAAVAAVTAEVGPTTEAEDLVAILGRATEAAQDAAADTASSVSDHERAVARQHGPPSSTFVAAVALERDYGLLLGVAWLGDSRAYWVGEEGSSLMTTDHELEGSLIRWLGADSGRVPPDIVTHAVTGAGRLVLCSDGLWRYASSPTDLEAVIDGLRAGEDDAALARGLVAHAIEGGGHDNITVALWSRREPSRAAASGDSNGVAEHAPPRQG